MKKIKKTFNNLLLNLKSSRLKKNDFIQLEYYYKNPENCFFIRKTDKGIVVYSENKRTNEVEYKIVLFSELNKIINLLKS